MGISKHPLFLQQLEELEVVIHVRVNSALRLRRGSDNMRKTGQSGRPHITGFTDFLKYYFIS